MVAFVGIRVCHKCKDRYSCKNKTEYKYSPPFSIWWSKHYACYIPNEDMQKIVDANEKLVKELKDAKD